MKRFLLVILLMFAALSALAQTDNTFYVKQFVNAQNRSVAAAVTAAQNSCNSNTSIPCLIVFDPTLSVYSLGTLPSACAQCRWVRWDNIVGGSTASLFPNLCASATVAGVPATPLQLLNLSGCVYSGGPAVVNALYGKWLARSTFNSAAFKEATGAGYRGDSNVLNTFINPILSINAWTITTRPANCFLLTNDATYNGGVGSDSTANVFINPICEGATGFGLAFLKADENFSYGGTSEGNGGALQISGDRNMVEGLHAEANTGTTGVEITGNNNVLRNHTNGVAHSNAAVYIHPVGGSSIQNRVEGGYISSIKIDGPNQYTTLENVDITSALTDADTTTRYLNVMFFNGSSWRRLPDRLPNFTAIVGDLTNAWSVWTEATDGLRVMGRGMSSASGIDVDGTGWDECKNGSTAIKCVVNMGAGGGYVVGTQGLAPTTAPHKGGLSVRMYNGSANPNRRVDIDFDNTAGKGYIQCAETSVSTLPCQINPGGGNVELAASGSDVIVKGGVGDGSGAKHKRIAGCATTAAAGAVCTTTVTWTTAFADANYTATCSGDVVTSGVPTDGGFSAKAAASVTFRTVAATAAAAQYTNVDCIAMHD